VSAPILAKFTRHDGVDFIVNVCGVETIIPRIDGATDGIPEGCVRLDYRGEFYDDVIGTLESIARKILFAVDYPHDVIDESEPDR
jgi:hypothetical protein